MDYKRLPKISSKKEEQGNAHLLRKAIEKDAFKHFVCAHNKGHDTSWDYSLRKEICQDDCANCPKKKYLNYKITQESIKIALGVNSQQTVSNSLRGGDNGLEFLARMSYAAQIPIWELINLLCGFHFDNNGIVVIDLDNDKGGNLSYV